MILSYSALTNTDANTCSNFITHRRFIRTLKYNGKTRLESKSMHLNAPRMGGFLRMSLSMTSVFNPNIWI